MRSVSCLWGSAVNPCLSENSSGRGCRILVYRGWLLPFDRQMPPARPITRPQIRSHLSHLSLLGALGLYTGLAWTLITVSVFRTDSSWGQAWVWSQWKSCIDNPVFPLPLSRRTHELGTKPAQPSGFLLDAVVTLAVQGCGSDSEMMLCFRKARLI